MYVCMCMYVSIVSSCYFRWIHLELSDGNNNNNNNNNVCKYKKRGDKREGKKSETAVLLVPTSTL